MTLIFSNHLLPNTETARSHLKARGRVEMSDTVQRVQARARELAGSGKFAGWRALAFELQFEPGFFEAYE